MKDNTQQFGVSRTYQTQLSAAKAAGEKLANRSQPIPQQTHASEFEVSTTAEFQQLIDQSHTKNAPVLEEQQSEVDKTTTTLNDYIKHSSSNDQHIPKRHQQTKEATWQSTVGPLKKQVELEKQESYKDEEEIQEQTVQVKQLREETGGVLSSLTSKIMSFVLLAICLLLELPFNFASIKVMRMSTFEGLVTSILFALSFGIGSHVVFHIVLKRKREPLTIVKKVVLWLTISILVGGVFFISYVRYRYFSETRPELGLPYFAFLFITLLGIAAGLLSAYLYHSKAPEAQKQFKVAKAKLSTLKMSYQQRRQRIGKLETEINAKTANIEKQFGDIEVGQDPQFIALKNDVQEAVSIYNQSLIKCKAFETSQVNTFPLVIQAFRSSNLARRTDGETPACFSNPIPTLHTYYEGLEPINSKFNSEPLPKSNIMNNLKNTSGPMTGTPKSTVPPKKKRSTIFSAGAILLFFLMSFFGQAQQHANIVILADISGSSHPLAKAPSSAFIMNLIGVDTEEKLENSATFTLATMGTLNHVRDYRYTLKSYESSFWSNELDRVDIIKKFMTNCTSAMAQVWSTSGDDYSRLYGTISRYLNNLAEKDGKKTAFIFSDLIESSPIVSAESFLKYCEDGNYEKLDQKFAAHTPLADLSGVTIYLVYQSNDLETDLYYGYARAYFTALFQSKNATVIYRSSLN